MVGHVRRRAAGVSLLLGSGAVISALPVLWPKSGPEVVEALLLVVVWMVLGVRLLRTDRFEAITAVVLAVVAMVPLAMIQAPGPAGVPEPTTVTPAAVAAVVAVLLLNRPWSCVLPVVVFLATAGVELATSGSAHAFDRSWPILVFAISVAGARLGLERAAVQTDMDLERHRAVELRLIKSRAQESAHNRWQSLLHDEVAAALRAGATPSVSRLEVRRSARAALQAIDEISDPEGTDTVDLIPQIREIVATVDLPISLVGPPEALVPSPIASALLGAITESVRNIDRHASGAPAQIRVNRADDLVTVEITDSGPGFVVPTRRRPGGVQVSVLDRMAQAGGVAQLTSSPGRGTTVTLRWPSDPGSKRPEPIEDVSRILGSAVLPVLVIAGILGAPSWTSGAHIFAAVWWLTQVVSAVWLTRRPPSWLVPVATVVSVLGAAISVVTSGTTGPWSKTWPMLAAAPVLLHMVIGKHPIWGWAATASLLVVTVPFAGADRHALAVGMTVIGVQAIGAAIAQVVRSMGADVAAAARSERETLEEAWRHSVLAEVHTRRQARLEDLVVPFLRRIADQNVPLDDEIRHEAGLLEQAVRDEMHLPEVLDPATRDLVGAARAKGCRVRLQADSSTGIPAATVCAVIWAVLDHGDLPQEFTLSVYVSTERASIAVVAVPGADCRRQAIEEVGGDRVLTIEDNEDATWAELRI